MHLELEAPASPHRRHIRGAGTAALALAALLVAAQLVLLQPLPAAAAGNCAMAENPIACENAKPGADPEEWDIEKAGDPTLQGFATEISVNTGESLDFKVKTDALAYSIDIYRTGWYQGLGARHIASVAPEATLPQRQPECLSDVTTELVDCGTWHRSAGWTVPADAVSGVYVALLRRPDTGGASHIIFIVRSDTSTADVVFQTSDPTWQAYNTYGGSDFYQGAANGRAYKVSYNRPIATRGDNDGRDFYFSAEFPMVRFLEKNGYDVTYQAGVDTDRRGEALKNHQVFLSVGHDEYWSGAQRANVEAARDAGVNLQFLSGNEMYWRTRYEPSPVDGGVHRTLVSYKETWANTKIDPAPEWTGTWRDPRIAPASQGGGVPENALTGTAYVANFSDLPITVSAEEGRYRLWRHTELAAQSPGSRTELAPHTIGYESNEDLDNGFRPPGLARLSTTVGPTPQYLRDYGNTVTEGITEHHLTQYRAPSGALVFSAGSVQWTWGLDREHDGWGAPADLRMQQAQVNLLADMGAQPASLDSTLTATPASGDATAPTAVVTSIQPGINVANGAPVTVAGTASDTGGQVAGVEVSTNDGETWHAAEGTSQWSYTYVQHGMDTQTVRVRAIDDSGNFDPTGVSAQLTVNGPYTVFGAQEPETADGGDGSAVEVGMRFTPSAGGFISGIRFYKAEANTGPHTGTLWDAAGTALATVSFTGGTTSGWQQAMLAEPVAVTAGSGYVVSYTAPSGHYATAPDYWSGRGNAAAPLLVAGGFGAPPAGVYNTVPGRFPADSYRNTNYFVDAVFDTTSNAPLSASSQLPADGAAGVALDTRITAVLSKEVLRESVSMVVRDAAGTPVEGSTRYSAASRTAEFLPAAELSAGTQHTVELAAVDTDGNGIASGGTWSFTTTRSASEGDCPCSLFSEDSIPQLPQLSDGIPLTLGVAFRPDAAGTITGVRFYKGPGNTGVHTGRLFGPGGAELAALTFSGESASGWQTATFPVPVPVQAGQEYVAAYTSPNGAYSANLGQFAGGYSYGPLSVPPDGGRFVYGGTYPERSSSSGYLVDVVYERGAPGLSVSARAPAAGAAGVPVNSTVSGTFSHEVLPGSVAVSLQGPDGREVSGQTGYDAGTRTATFTPAAALTGATEYTVRLTGTGAEDLVPDGSGTWTFTTAAASTEGECPCGLFPADTLPAVAQVADGRPVVLGTAFRSSADGLVSGIRFFKGAGNTGTHTGKLFAADGSVLASATFSSESSSGWQSVNFDEPVPIRGGNEYIAAYTSPTGTYSVTPGQFTGSYSYGPLSVDASGGRFSYAGGYPGSPSAASYLVDVLFDSGGVPPEVPDPENGCPCSLYAQADVPLIDRVLDGTPVTLGTAFSVEVPGQIGAVRFYRGEGNTGPHTGYLYDDAGTELARVLFAGGTNEGWQSATLDVPVAVTPGTEYTVAYSAPAGVYSATPGGFASGRDRLPLLVPANGGRYSYAGGFPTAPSGSSYLVDVVFTRPDQGSE
ncbi:DUF4082 domain-containing protein [Arthrobacter sp.]|uniref:DUF4082 domain-containing protein n=1 Tax=Arthrobacter sp. TaxID=1667 RepID=UPI002896A5DF|nr:DUF4082 domain-containing protein [Arthrobacter sp.]